MIIFTLEEHSLSYSVLKTWCTRCHNILKNNPRELQVQTPKKGYIESSGFGKESFTTNFSNLVKLLYLKLTGPEMIKLNDFLKEKHQLKTKKDGKWDSCPEWGVFSRFCSFWLALFNKSTSLEMKKKRKENVKN